MYDVHYVCFSWKIKKVKCKQQQRREQRPQQQQQRSSLVIQRDTHTAKVGKIPFPSISFHHSG